MELHSVLGDLFARQLVFGVPVGMSVGCHRSTDVNTRAGIRLAVGMPVCQLEAAVESGHLLAPQFV
jgi:hypothetical protein